jgi:hypothetical protein
MSGKIAKLALFGLLASGCVNLRSRPPVVVLSSQTIEGYLRHHFVEALDRYREKFGKYPETVKNLEDKRILPEVVVLPGKYGKRILDHSSVSDLKITKKAEHGKVVFYITYRIYGHAYQEVDDPVGIAEATSK